MKTQRELIAKFSGDLPSHPPAHFSYLRGGWKHPSKSERYEMPLTLGNGIFPGEVKVSKFLSSFFPPTHPLELRWGWVTFCWESSDSSERSTQPRWEAEGKVVSQVTEVKV